MTPPITITPAKILSFFIIFSLKNPALSGGVSVGGEDEGGNPSGVKDGGDPSGIKDGTNPSGMECCEGIGVGIESCEGTDPADGAEKYCEDSDPPDADEYGVGINSSEFQSVDDDRWCEGVNLSAEE
jgi:hypothetical protein